MAEGITDLNEPPGAGFKPSSSKPPGVGFKPSGNYNTNPKSYGFKNMDSGDYGATEKSYLDSTLPFMQEREKRAGKRLSARNAAMGITDSPASQKLYSETVEEPYPREESAIRGTGAQMKLGAKERDIDRWNSILGELTGRGFSREERLGSQEFGTSEREAGQGFTTSERKAGEKFVEHERLGGEQFANSERVATQLYATGERANSEKWQSSERTAAQEHDTAMAKQARIWQGRENRWDRGMQKEIAEMGFEDEGGGKGIGGIGNMTENLGGDLTMRDPFNSGATGQGTTTENAAEHIATGGLSEAKKRLGF